MSFCFPEEPDRLARKANRTEVCPYRQPTSAASEPPLVKIRSDRETSGKILDFRGQVHGNCWLFYRTAECPTVSLLPPPQNAPLSRFTRFAKSSQKDWDLCGLTHGICCSPVKRCCFSQLFRDDYFAKRTRRKPVSAEDAILCR